MAFMELGIMNLFQKMCAKNDLKSGIWWIALPTMTVCLYSVLCVCMSFWLKTI